MFVSAVCKKLDDGHDDIDDDEEDPELQSDEEWMHLPRESRVIQLGSFILSHIVYKFSPELLEWIDSQGQSPR